MFSFRFLGIHPCEKKSEHPYVCLSQHFMCMFVAALFIMAKKKKKTPKRKQHKYEKFRECLHKLWNIYNMWNLNKKCSWITLEENRNGHDIKWKDQDTKHNIVWRRLYYLKSANIGKKYVKMLTVAISGCEFYK